MNPAKKAVTKGRNVLLGGLIRSVDQLLQHTAQVQSKQLELEAKLDDIQNRQINTGALEVGDHQIIVKLFNGLKLYLDTRDISLTPHVALDGIWEPEITKAWVAHINPGDVVFDIGANFGYFGLLAAHLVGKKTGKVIFFEPNPNLVNYIHQTLNLNWYNEQSVVEGSAVSDKESTMTLNILKGYIASSTLQSIDKLKGYLDEKMEIEVEQAVDVPVIKLDDYCKQRGIKQIDVMKMDIEGFEDKAYAGMRSVVAQSTAMKLFIEFTKEAYEQPVDFYKQMLADFGHVYTISPDGDLLVPKKTDYASMVGDAEDWAMLVFSKRKLT
jgi:FkbM family methyltransferase